MKPRHFSQEQKNFYKNLKKSLDKENGVVFGSTARTTDLVFLDWKKNIELYKIVLPSEKQNVSIWINRLKKIYTLAWFKAEYNLIYVNDDFIEQKREKFLLN